MDVILIEDVESLKIYNDIWSKLSNSIKKNLIANASTIKSFRQPK